MTARFFFRGGELFSASEVVELCVFEQRVWEKLLHLQKRVLLWLSTPVSGSDYTRRAEAGDHHIWTEPNHNGDGTSTGYWLQDALKG